MNTLTYDVVILGTGPAGLSAAVAARGRGKKVLVLGKRWQDSPLAKAERVDNYLGMPNMTGAEMMEQFEKHALDMGAELVLGRVDAVMTFDGFHVTVGTEIYQGKTLILAPGVVRQTKYAGEDTYLGRGVSYCATCDGMLYRGKEVVVVGRSSEAPHEAAYLQQIGCHVTYVASKRPDTLPEQIPFVQGNRLEIQGEQTVTGLVVDGTVIPCQGVFILREAVAPDDLVVGLQVEKGVIQVDRNMSTGVEGVFAAGDCTGEPLQISKAVGEGLIAGLSAAQYCDNH